MLLIFYTAIMEIWTSMALSNFPRLWDVKIIWPFHDIKMTENLIILRLWGKPQMLWKCGFIKSNLVSFLRLSGVHKNLNSLLQNYFWQWIITDGSKVKSTQNEFKLHFCSCPWTSWYQWKWNLFYNCNNCHWDEWAAMTWEKHPP